jgi:hypothetical protein
MIKRITDFNIEELLLWKSSELYRQVSADFYFTDKSLEYNNEYFGSAYQDYSFISSINGNPLIAIYAIFKEQTFEFYNWPVKIHTLQNANADDINLASKNAITYIEMLHKKGVINQLRYYDNAYFNGGFFHLVTDSKLQYHAIIDLKLSAQTIKSNVRRSYKSLINWGERNLTHVLLNKENPDHRLFLEFQNFHIKTSGRKTRSDRSWEIQFDMIRNGNAFLMLFYWNEKLVSGNLCLHGFETAFYGVAVNERSLMAERLPIGHYPIYSSILHAKKIGMNYFHMNKIEFHQEDKKLNQLALFKSGFASTYRCEVSHWVNFTKQHEG